MDILPFIIFTAIAFSIGAVLILISNFLGTKHKGVRKNDVYESGMDPVGNANKKYDVKFFLTAIVFLLFDVEIVFLFPWALSYADSASKTLMIMEFAFFMIILIVGYVFILASKSLDWEN